MYHQGKINLFNAKISLFSGNSIEKKKSKKVQDTSENIPSDCTYTKGAALLTIKCHK